MSLARQLAYVELNGWGFGAAPRGQKAGLTRGPRCISGARQPRERERVRGSAPTQGLLQGPTGQVS